ncbi:MAG: T9SS type A sorting domain-containing protein [Bacteroidota bacterium]
MGILDHAGSASFSIYPVPNNGQFTVMISSPVDEIFTIMVYNQIGVKLFGLSDAATVGGKFETQIYLRPITSGMYLVAFMNSENKVVRKIFVNQ